MFKNISYVFLSFFLLSVGVPIYAQNRESKDKNLNVVTLSPINYEEEVSKGIVLVDYWASWCRPCRKLDPILKDVVRETGVKLGKLNVDNYEFFVSKKNISTIPTVIFYKDGKEIQRLVGIYTKQEFLQILNPYLHKTSVEHDH